MLYKNFFSTHLLLSSRLIFSPLPNISFSLFFFFFFKKELMVINFLNPTCWMVVCMEFQTQYFSLRFQKSLHRLFIVIVANEICCLYDCHSLISCLAFTSDYFKFSFILILCTFTMMYLGVHFLNFASLVFDGLSELQNSWFHS